MTGVQGQGDGAVCTCPYTDPSTWLSAYSCGYGSGYEPGSMQEWDPDCPVHPPTPAPPVAGEPSGEDGLAVWPDPDNWPTDAEYVAAVKAVPTDFPLCDCGVQDGTSEATNPADRTEVLPHHFDCSAVTAWAAVQGWHTALLAAAVEQAKREAWDEGWDRAEYMARCWGHTDSWGEEDPYPVNPYTRTGDTP